jgi:hypothetical protein
MADRNSWGVAPVIAPLASCPCVEAHREEWVCVVYADEGLPRREGQDEE